MTSRRQFIKKGLFSSLGALPFSHLNNNNAMQELKNSSSDDELFALVRNQLLVPKGRIYLNTGSLGPSPIVVTDAVQAMMRQLEMNPAIENWGDLGKQMEQVRTKVGAFINADPDDVILTRNTTEGLSLISQSLKLTKGDEILTTTHEHGGGEIGLEYLALTHKVLLLKNCRCPFLLLQKKQLLRRW